MFLDFFTRLYVQVQVFFHRKEGASGIEYAIVAAMVAVVIAGFTTSIGTEVKGVFSKLSTALTGTGTGS
ncbi:Flp family type IVb pilin [Pseudomonas gingeri]|uniref:Flp family type IVb pilin n=1 Tax=Pseudomonas gingeri TaxID=117681 RepID=A0A7Y7Y805_9PSED|nr:Flp family type IVb pilin [Pseudomonas gingeri]NWB30764.1 Flp family type IVb pilin [Pseudomonas gingeri]NWC31388.1 Flp family type IVb pilin [Pseudomonas gingeri]NWD09143.1 Flp family type IVb pilin [Pseudomonas gingeri]NWD50636.1 Flp family type IVb pilin [Pseudomonas gingeri]NWE35014.1 Flp family type IVb pilin [Pseudomonas gingeri]